MLTSNKINQLFKSNFNFMSNEKGQTHPIFDGLMAAIHPSKNKLDTPTLDAMQEQNKRDKEDESIAEIARKSHFNNRMSEMYYFLQLTPENEATYELGFMAGVMYATGEMNKLHDKQKTPTLERYEGTGILDAQNDELIN